MEQNTDLTTEIRELRAEVERLNGHRFLRVQNSLPRMLLWSMLRGLAMGLGTVIGATVVVSAAAFVLSQIDFIPILGDWAAEIAREISDQVPTADAPAEVPADVPPAARENGTGQ